MSAITFSVRYVFFSSHMSFELNEKVNNFLKFTAPCILTAMWTPIVFGSIDQESSLLNNPYLIAGVATILISLLIKNTLTVVLLSISIFACLKYFV